MGFRVFIVRRSNFILTALLALAALACNLSVSLPSFSTPPPAPTTAPVPIPTPTPLHTLSAGHTAQNDAARLYFAERRIIDVYKRVAPAVVNITTQMLQRDFFFDVVPAEGSRAVHKNYSG
jgi:hypothetical protein